MTLVANPLSLFPLMQNSANSLVFIWNMPLYMFLSLMCSFQGQTHVRKYCSAIFPLAPTASLPLQCLGFTHRPQTFLHPPRDLTETGQFCVPPASPRRPVSAVDVPLPRSQDLSLASELMDSHSLKESNVERRWRGGRGGFRPPQSRGDPSLPPRRFPPLPTWHTHVEKVRSW